MAGGENRVKALIKECGFVKVVLTRKLSGKLLLELDGSLLTSGFAYYTGRFLSY